MKELFIAFIESLQNIKVILNKVHEISNGILQYIGEWHTHPEPQPRPSNCDYQGWSQLISNGKFNELPKLLWIAGNKSYKEDWFSLLLNKKILCFKSL
ncbi:hypothetical protein BJI62_20455 [Acinetobacter pittii]|nr:hypothetical protein BJI62_20455 [Acinetobacter pittii]